VLHYQPKVSLMTGKLMGAEALIRWNDPHTGLVPPIRFIPVLEETGLINEVGRWALCKAVDDYLSWRRAGLPAVRIAVNVSPLQLGNRGFVSEIEKVIGIDPLAAAGLELEITESLIMADVKHSVSSLQKIRSMGVTVAIDDFGTGFSSLSYLAKLPINTLKIDRSFIVEMTSTPEANALVTMIITLAHSLKLNVVAEGVETEEQASILRALGCDENAGILVQQAGSRGGLRRTFFELTQFTSYGSLVPLTVAAGIAALLEIIVVLAGIDVVPGGIDEYQTTGTLHSGHERGDDSAGQVDRPDEGTAVSGRVRRSRNEGFLFQCEDFVQVLIGKENETLG